MYSFTLAIGDASCTRLGRGWQYKAVFVPMDADSTYNDTCHPEYLLKALSVDMNLNASANPTDLLWPLIKELKAAAAAAAAATALSIINDGCLFK